MAVINVVQWARKGKLPGREVELPMSFLKSENVTVTTAQKYELESGTRIVELAAMEGGVYARSDHAGSGNITTGTGVVVATSLGIAHRYLIVEEFVHSTGNPRLLMIEFGTSPMVSHISMLLAEGGDVLLLTEGGDPLLLSEAA